MLSTNKDINNSIYDIRFLSPCNQSWEKAPGHFQMMYVKYLKSGKSSSIITVNRDKIYIRNSPIFDWNSIMIFVSDTIPVGWRQARKYQAWAYLNFLYDDKKVKTYYSKNSYIFPDECILLPFDDLPSGIIFKIISIDNKIYYEKNDLEQTKVCISSNKAEQDEYLKYYLKTTNKFIFPPDSTWFFNTFGFNEDENYHINRTKLKNHLNIVDIKDGKLEFYNLSRIKHDIIELDIEYVTNSSFNAPITFEHIIGDIIDLQKNLENNDASFQIASQFNCLEMIDQYVSPIDGITNYYKDKTQGPLAVICTPYALAWRNYVFKDYTHESQIDMTHDLLSYFQTINLSISWHVINGYLIIDEDNLNKINEILKIEVLYNNAKEYVVVCMQRNVNVILNGVYYNTISHIFCSGIPLSYYPNNMINKNDWNLLSMLILETQYELTMLCSIYNNILKNNNQPLFLTKIGVGAFGMNKNILIKAIEKAYNNIKKLKHSLYIKLVHYKTIESDYDNIIS